MAEPVPRRIGELAAATGLTVRTLHHYDRLGLLTPSGRTVGGHRCYSDDDVRRLHRIIALRGFGLTLTEIRTALDAGPDADPADLLRRQLIVVEDQLRRSLDVRSRLLAMLTTLDQTVEPSTTQFLHLIEETMMMNQTPTPEQIAAMIEARRASAARLSEAETAEMTSHREERYGSLSEHERHQLEQSLRQAAPPPAATYH